MASPSGGSTLITSAPRSASTWAAERPGDEGGEVEHLQATRADPPRYRSSAARTARSRSMAGLTCRRQQSSGATVIGEPTTMSWRTVEGDGQADLGAGAARPAPPPGRDRLARHAGRRGAARSTRRAAGWRRTSANAAARSPSRPAHLVGVVALGARLVAEHLEQLGVHALAAEPHLDELAVGAAVQEVRERRALLPVALDRRGGPLGPSDHAAERGEHAVVERGLGPAAGAGEGPAPQEGEHRGGEEERRARTGGADVDEDRAGAVAGELGAEPGPGLDEQAVVVDLARRRCGSAGTGRRRATGWPRSEVVVAEAALLDRPLRCRRPAPRRHREQFVEHRSRRRRRATTRLSRCHGRRPRDDRRRSTAGVGADDADDVRAEVGEEHARRTPRPGRGRGR